MSRCRLLCAAHFSLVLSVPFRLMSDRRRCQTDRLNTCVSCRLFLRFASHRILRSSRHHRRNPCSHAPRFFFARREHNPPNQSFVRSWTSLAGSYNFVQPRNRTISLLKAQQEPEFCTSYNSTFLGIEYLCET